ncbi:3-methyl-2-oxobutanoate hydroxymethyltransferase [Corynebacterium propinquum]|uniref:3-methyl-2-oxobutanoate hydroxymethyltransferase n=1 Tax=Corynebacterium propinquum TaxID=43769 RepID=UPI0025431E24|nr:3-methyl-2-oxobutanoate hydroxymethyltransferase [Corynebacterium propinquum]MDK4301927.1 3-methyl-2-oxobutanoate hydroxymethyltransferase [Corynebacterium propinquum]
MSTQPSRPLQRLRTHYFSRAKASGTPFTALTSYDSLTASIFDDAEIDLLLVGDSAANVVFGHSSTLPITTEELISLSAAVVRSTRRAFVVADLPFGSYETSPAQAVDTAVRFMKEAGVQAVKIEGGVEIAPTIKALVDAGIPVCAHIGFTPQAEHALGGYRVQGRGEAAAQLAADAHAVADAGAFAVVMEMVPSQLAAQITRDCPIPTIGIGAGNETDGQILVWTDAFGLGTGKPPRFVRQYANLADELHAGARAYREDVAARAFPNEAESFSDEK